MHAAKEESRWRANNVTHRICLIIFGCGQCTYTKYLCARWGEGGAVFYEDAEKCTTYSVLLVPTNRLLYYHNLRLRVERGHRLLVIDPTTPIPEILKKYPAAKNFLSSRTYSQFSSKKIRSQSLVKGAIVSGHWNHIARDTSSFWRCWARTYVHISYSDVDEIRNVNISLMILVRTYGIIYVPKQ